MSTCAAATIVARPLLAYARVLAASFREHHPDIPFFVLLADPEGAPFDGAREPFATIRFEEIALRGKAELAACYEMQPLSYALTPSLLTHLLDRGFSRVIFIKQESLVLDRLTPVFDLLAEAPIALTPHLLEPLQGAEAIARELNVLQSGIYNIGLLGVSERPEAREFLAWWTDRVQTHCRHDVPGGMHFEQRWVDLAPCYFPGTRVIRNPAFNVGHWNLPERDGLAAALIRFSGFNPLTPGIVSRYTSRHAGLTLQCTPIFERYARLLIAAGFERGA